MKGQQPSRQNLTYGLDLAYATSEIFDEKELEAGLVVSQTYTSDADEKMGLDHRLYFDYPNDLVEFSGSWIRADDTFNPEVGYVRRSSYQRFESELAISPRPSFLPFIQQLEFKPWERSYYEDDLTGELQSFYAEFVPLALTTRTGESMEFAETRRAENLDEPFELFDDAEIPEGEYEHNRVSLGGDSFPVDEVGARADFAFTPTLFGAVSGQWNNEDEEVILNFRLNWIPRPGSDLFLVINQEAETWDSRWNPTHTAVLTKLVWRMAF